MGVVPGKVVSVSRGAEPAATGAASAPAQRAAGDPLNYDDLLREYNQLRERSGRTTNALASAAHDLKTPLAILTGYVELLQSEKLGTAQRAAAGSPRRHAHQRAAFAAVYPGFSEL